MSFVRLAWRAVAEATKEEARGGVDGAWCNHLNAQEWPWLRVVAIEGRAAHNSQVVHERVLCTNIRLVSSLPELALDLVSEIA